MTAFPYFHACLSLVLPLFRSSLAPALLVALAVGTAHVASAQSQPPKRPAPPKDTLTSAEREQLREASRDARSIARRRINPDSMTRRTPRRLRQRHRVCQR